MMSKLPYPPPLPSFSHATQGALLADAQFKLATWDYVQDTTTATTKWGAIGDLDVSGVTDFNYAFSRNRNAVGGTFATGECAVVGQCMVANPKAMNFAGTDLSKWNTASATTMVYTFNGAAEMNADVSGWNVAKVTLLYSTFGGASKFVGTGLSSWDTASATSLGHTFNGAVEMNADLSAWKVNKVTDMINTFRSTSSLTSCNKRKIADAWKSSSAFFTYKTDWATDTCPVRFE